MTHRFTALEQARWLGTLHKRVSSAAMIIEDEHSHLLIVKANYKDHWTLPGGIIDANETPLQAAIRETEEEVGLTIDPDTVTFAWVASRTSSRMQTYQFIFRTTVSHKMFETIKLQASEIEDYALVSADRVVSGDRDYGQVLKQWANRTTGYVEQSFG